MLKRYCMIMLLGFCLFAFSACSNNSQASSGQINKESEEKKETKEEPKIEVVEEKEVTLNLIYGERNGTYTGEIINDLPNGQGKFTTKNEEGKTWYYEGGFKDGHFNGEGKTIWEDGQVQSGNFENDVWKPNSFQVYSFLNSIKIISYTDEAKAFLENHMDIFPTDSFDKISEFIDESVEYKMIKKEPEKYGDKIIKLEDIMIAQIFANPIRSSSDEKYTYAIGFDGENCYQLYFIGDMEDIYAEDTISTLYGLPISANGYNNAGGGYTHTVDLAVCYYEK